MRIVYNQWKNFTQQQKVENKNIYIQNLINLVFKRKNVGRMHNK